MNRFIKNTFIDIRGQSTLELALLTPIVFVLIYFIIQAYQFNSRSILETLEQHQFKLDKLDHGNGAFVLDGVDIPDPPYAELLPGIPPVDLTDLLTKEGANLLAHLGLNLALSEISIFDGKTYITGALRGSVQSAGSSYIDSGFKTIDWEGAGWGALTGALQSEQATADFQGSNPTNPSWKEALGSAVQSGAVAYSQSHGNTEALLAGSVSGLLGSDTFNKAEFTKNEILLGAAKGAIQSTVTGALEGKIEFENIAIATGMGAFQTKAVASKIPLSHWSGDPRQSASFQAVNAALAASISGGSSKEALYAAASGAFFSGQSMQTISNGNFVGATLASATYGAGMGLIQGQSLEAVGQSALQGVATGLAVREISKKQEALAKYLSGKSRQEIEALYQANPRYRELTEQEIILKMEDDARWSHLAEAAVNSRIELMELQEIPR